jgi:hypothetical protein
MLIRLTNLYLQEQPKPEPKQSRGGGSGGDMMAEMQRKLAARLHILFLKVIP